GFLRSLQGTPSGARWLPGLAVGTETGSNGALHLLLEFCGNIRCRVFEVFRKRANLEDVLIESSECSGVAVRQSYLLAGRLPSALPRPVHRKRRRGSAQNIQTVHRD